MFLRTWTNEETTQLLQLRAEQLSAGAIAKRMEITRNAVMGKLNRMGLVGRVPPTRIEAEARREDALREQKLARACAFEIAWQRAKGGVTCATPACGGPRQPGRLHCNVCLRKRIEAAA